MTIHEIKMPVEEDSSKNEDKNEKEHKRPAEDQVQEHVEKKAKHTEEEEQPRGQVRPLENEDQEEDDVTQKRQKIGWAEIMFQTLIPEMKKIKGQKEIKLKDLLPFAREKLIKAIQKEVNNNINAGAYEILSPEESKNRLQHPPAPF